MFVIENVLAECPGLTANGLAMLAGVPASTVQGVLKGAVEPKVSTLARIAAGAGFHLLVEAVPDVDESVIGLIVALGEQRPVPRQARRWQQILEKTHGGQDLSAILNLCRLHANPTDRAVTIAKSPASLDLTVGLIDGAAGRHRWLVSGPDALRAAGLSIDGPRIVYSDHPHQVADALSNNESTLGTPKETFILPMTDATWAARQILGPYEHWVSVYQAMADTAASPQMIDAIVHEWETR